MAKKSGSEFGSGRKDGSVAKNGSHGSMGKKDGSEPKGGSGKKKKKGSETKGKKGSETKKKGSKLLKFKGGAPGPEAAAPQAPPAGRWSEAPDEHDYPAAAAFLSLICEPTEVRRIVSELKAASVVHYKAKDLLRSSGLTLLPADNIHVAVDLAKVSRGERLSPVLLLRGDFRRGMPMTIADGYHRVCASYHVSENEDIPCHLVDHKAPVPTPGFRRGNGVTTPAGAGSGAGPGLGARPASGVGSGPLGGPGGRGSPRGTGGPGDPVGGESGSSVGPGAGGASRGA
jgi:hypothetical protein